MIILTSQYLIVFGLQLWLRQEARLWVNQIVKLDENKKSKWINKLKINRDQIAKLDEKKKSKWINKLKMRDK